MTQFKITFEEKQAVGEIQRKFKSQLSEKQILTVTARAINITAYRAQSFIKKQIKKEYTVNNKYLDRYSQIKHRAQSNTPNLYASIDFKYTPIPMIGFTHSGGRNKQIVEVSIRRGSPQQFRHAFIGKFSGVSNKGEHYEHEGILAQGKYVKGQGFVYLIERTKAQPNNGRNRGNKIRVSELKSVSAFTMATSVSTRASVELYIADGLPKRLEALLQKKIDRIKSNK